MPAEHPTINETVLTPESGASSTSDTSAASSKESSGADAKGAEGVQTLNEDGTPKAPVKEAGKEKVAGEEAGKEAGGEETRLDKHPRFQEVIKARQDADGKVASLQAENAALKAQMATAQQVKPAEPGGRNYQQELGDLGKKLDEGDISQSEYMGKYTEIIRAESNQGAQEMIAQSEKQSRVISLEDQFLKDNPSYMEVFRAGKLDAIKTQHPLLDNISAFKEYERLEAVASIEAKVNEAVEKTKAEMIDQFKAKGSATVLGEGSTAIPSEKPAGEAPEMKDPKKFGGSTNVLANRLALRRKEKAGL